MSQLERKVSPNEGNQTIQQRLEGLHKEYSSSQQVDLKEIFALCSHDACEALMKRRDEAVISSLIQYWWFIQKDQAILKSLEGDELTDFQMLQVELRLFKLWPESNILSDSFGKLCNSIYIKDAFKYVNTCNDVPLSLQTITDYLFYCQGLHKIDHKKHDSALQSEVVSLIHCLFGLYANPKDLKCEQKITAKQVKQVIDPYYDYVKNLLHPESSDSDDQAALIHHAHDGPSEDKHQGNPVLLYMHEHIMKAGRGNSYEKPSRFSGAIQQANALVTVGKAKKVVMKATGFPYEIKLVHDKDYLLFLEARAQLAKMLGFAVPVDVIDCEPSEKLQLGGTWIDDNIWRAIIEGAAAAQQATLHIIDKNTDEIAAYCLTRPPGHHAHSNRSGGFCFVNNAAIAAITGLLRGEQVLWIDFDVHSGDGSIEILKDFLDRNPKFKSCIYFINLYHEKIFPHQRHRVSIKRMTNYPIHSQVFPAGTDGVALRAAIDKCISAKLKDFGASLVVFSAGFDGHKDETIVGDKQGKLQDNDYGLFVKNISGWFPKAKIIAITEGGYVASAVAGSVKAMLQALHVHSQLKPIRSLLGQKRSVRTSRAPADPSPRLASRQRTGLLPSSSEHKASEALALAGSSALFANGAEASRESPANTTAGSEATLSLVQ